MYFLHLIDILNDLILICRKRVLCFHIRVTFFKKKAIDFQFSFHCLLKTHSKGLDLKILCNFVQEAPDNFAQEKILCNIVLILLEQCCTRSKPYSVVLCNFVLILLGQHCTGKTLFNFEETPNNTALEKI